MEHKEAADILIKLVSDGKFKAKEKEALMTAIGVLAWTSLSKSRVKSLKTKRDKDLEWK